MLPITSVDLLAQHRAMMNASHKTGITVAMMIIWVFSKGTVSSYEVTTTFTLVVVIIVVTAVEVVVVVVWLVILLIEVVVSDTL